MLLGECRPEGKAPRARWRMPAAAGALAAAVGGSLVLLGPPGVDLAAHAYLTSLVAHHGLVVWDSSWYAGRYPFLTYSLLYYPLAALVGVQLLGVASVAVGAAGFAGLAGEIWGRRARPASLAFGLVWGGVVLSAAYPFVLGVAAGLLGLWVLASSRPLSEQGTGFAGRRSHWRFALLALVAFASSPLALVLLVLALTSVGVAWPRSARRLAGPGAVVVALVATQLVLMRLFPDYGRYPFWWADLVEIEVFCAAGVLLSWRVGGARLLWAFFALYGLASLAAFLVPSDLGANLAVVRYIAVPLAALACGLRSFRPRWLCWPALALAAWWNLAPLVSAFAEDGAGPESQAFYWAPAVVFLAAHLEPGERVEVVDTVGHWGAYYLPLHGIPIARGWFRQDDFPTNDLLYGPSPLRRSAYLAWLRSLGVAYVVLPDAPLDFSSKAEAALLEGGGSGLAVADRSAHLTVFAVPSPATIVTGPGAAKVVSDGREALTVALDAAGSYRLAVHWSRYWVASRGCLSPTSSGMTELRVGRPGLVSLRLEVTAGRLWSAFLGRSPPPCAAHGRA